MARCVVEMWFLLSLIRTGSFPELDTLWIFGKWCTYQVCGISFLLIWTNISAEQIALKSWHILFGSTWPLLYHHPLVEWGPCASPLYIGLSFPSRNALLVFSFKVVEKCSSLLSARTSPGLETNWLMLNFLIEISVGFFACTYVSSAIFFFILSGLPPPSSICYFNDLYAHFFT